MEADSPLAGLLSVLRGMLPEGSTRGSVARHQLVAALDIQDLWRWCKANPEAVTPTRPWNL